MDYELEPERPKKDPSVDDSSYSTQHHESLLRAEAARASRTNRVLGSFVVAGLAAATVLGVVTWQTAVPADNRATSAEEAYASDTMEPSDDQDAASGDPDAADDDADNGADADPDRADEAADGVDADLTPLTDDQYAPPNAWSGDQFVGPGAYSGQNGGGTQADTSADGAAAPETDTYPETGEAGIFESPDGGVTTGTTTDDPDRSSIVDLLPDLTELPLVPGGGDSPSKGNQGGQSAEQEEPTEPTEPAEPAEPAEQRSQPGSSSAAPGDDNTRDTRSTDDGVTDTTGPTP